MKINKGDVVFLTDEELQICHWLGMERNKNTLSITDDFSWTAPQGPRFCNSLGMECEWAWAKLENRFPSTDTNYKRGHVEYIINGKRADIKGNNCHTNPFLYTKITDTVDDADFYLLIVKRGKNIYTFGGWTYAENLIRESNRGTLPGKDTREYYILTPDHLYDSIIINKDLSQISRR